MNNDVDIEALKVNTCACCGDILLETDDIMIPDNADDVNIICKACHDANWANPNIKYQECLIINKIYCPTCDDFMIGYIPKDHMYAPCPDCREYVNIMSYKDVYLKRKK